MRKVNVYMYRDRTSELGIERCYRGQAWFHQFSTEYEIQEEGITHYPCAIIELETGKIEIVHATLIEFCDPFTKDRHEH